MNLNNRIPLFEKDGFIITFEALPEDTDMYSHFINECGWTTQQYEEIENFEWFIAKVSAWKDGKEYGNSYLGACCYETIEEFYTTYKDDDYLKQMVDEALQEAKEAYKAVP